MTDRSQQGGNTPQHWIREELRHLSAYHVPDASGLIKLDAMENPFVWPDELRQQWADLLVQTDVNRYPDPAAEPLKQQLRQVMGMPTDMPLLLGNGSDEIIQILCMALAGPGRALLSVDPGFVMYRMIATFCGMKYIGVPLQEKDFSLDMPAMRQAIDQYQPAVVFLAYPNNPTGNLFDKQQLLEIINAAPGLVVIDEAYAPFADHSFVSRLGEFDNLLVMRTVSKMGLAGLRLGLLAGPSSWLDEFEKLRLPYNINTLTQKSALFALQHQTLFDEQSAEIRRQRSRLFEALSARSELQVFPSQANFLLVRTPAGRAPEIHSKLREHGILIKLLDGSQPALADCLRVTVGTEQENDQLLKVLGEVL
ncbi:MAG: histidinol-phosphate transaminase [Chromatiales bacterium]|jgi:histidinol-phosphate aminotransferase